MLVLRQSVVLCSVLSFLLPATSAAIGKNHSQSQPLQSLTLSHTDMYSLTYQRGGEPQSSHYRSLIPEHTGQCSSESDSGSVMSAVNEPELPAVQSARSVSHKVNRDFAPPSFDGNPGLIYPLSKTYLAVTNSR